MDTKNTFIDGRTDSLTSGGINESVSKDILSNWMHKVNNQGDNLFQTTNDTYRGSLPPRGAWIEILSTLGWLC